jgi:hypothetical protein
MSGVVPVVARRCGWAVVAWGLMLPGCTEAESPGEVEVRWRTGALSCGEAGVGEVRAELFDFGDTEFPSASASTVCEHEKLSIEDVDPGEYALVLKGLDADGCWTHEARRDDLVVSSGEDVVVDELALKRRLRPVQVKWPFANLSDCLGNGVEQVKVTIDVEDRFSEVYTFGCPGLERDIVGVPEGEARFTVVALDGNGDALAEGTVDIDAEQFRASPCEDRVVVLVWLSVCEEAGC